MARNCCPAPSSSGINWGLLAIVGTVIGAIAATLFELGEVLGTTVLTAGPAALWLAWWAWWPSRRLPAHRVRHLRWRLRLRLRPGRGHATAFELHARWSRRACFTESARARPSLTFWQRALGPAAAYSVAIGRAHYRHGLRIPLQENAFVLGPPRGGKTGMLGSVMLRYPGPVLSTTTKADLYQLTQAVRARYGPVLVFNPQQVGAVPSTFSWDPLDGCRNPATAIRRADAFAQSVSQKGVEDGSFWSAKASDYLRGYFHAAALAGLSMLHVAAWAAGGRPGEAEQILANGGHPQWALTLSELHGEAQKTAQTVRMVMTRALSFLADPALARCVLPQPGEGLDIGAFLRSCGSLYLIAEADGDDSPMAPLFACLTSEIRYQAALAGSRMPGGRLDPSLLMALDEVTQICPVPLASWLADSGGKGVQIITVAHGVAQLRSRWGDDAAQAILDTSGVKICLPGVTDTVTLRALSDMCGVVAMRERGHDAHTRHPIMAEDMIRQIPAGRALVVRGGLAPVIARLPLVWKDPLYKRARSARPAPAGVAARWPDAIEAGPVLAPVGGPRPAIPAYAEPPLVAADAGAYPWQQR